MKTAVKKIVPNNILLAYHKALAVLAEIIYKKPSEKMIVIGVTGTNGKSSTVELISKVLEQTGKKVGSTSSIKFKIGDQESLNTSKMTMLGRFKLQKILSQMVKKGCSYAVIETSSQGIDQFRHIGINYDIAVFTNITPEHIEAHGSFENYKQAKGKLFEHLTAKKKKNIDNKEIPKISVINLDDEHAPYFAQFKADKKYVFAIEGKIEKDVQGMEVVKATDVNYSPNTNFKAHDTLISLQLLGEYNIYNSLAAVCVGLSQGMDMEKIKNGLESVEGIPGRLEFIQEGQNYNVIVDYAPEPESLTQTYEVVKKLNPHKIIHVLGSCGGGRDEWRRPVMGKIAGRNAEYVIITNEDPYNEDPQKIINQVADGALKEGKELDINLFKILDRRQAITKAITLARENDLVLITGKGSEQAMAVRNKLIPWDDRNVVREILKR